jgi:hypothetical protein
MGRASNRKWTKRAAAYATLKKDGFAEDCRRLWALFGERLKRMGVRP